MTSIVPQDAVLEDNCPSLGFMSLTFACFGSLGDLNFIEEP